MKESLSIYISIISLLISIIVAFHSWWKARANLQVDQFLESAGSVYFKTFDGCLEATIGEPKEAPYFVSVALIDVILTNKSSEPLSILEFSIPDYPVFNSYSRTQNSFTATVAVGSYVQIGEDIPIKYLKPEFTISPYTSRRGYLLFWSGLEKDMDITKDIKLTIKTSRKSMTKNIKITEKYDSIKKYGVSAILD